MRILSKTLIMFTWYIKCLEIIALSNYVLVKILITYFCLILLRITQDVHHSVEDNYWRITYSQQFNCLFQAILSSTLFLEYNFITC